MAYLSDMERTRKRMRKRHARYRGTKKRSADDDAKKDKGIVENAKKDVSDLVRGFRHVTEKKHDVKRLRKIARRMASGRK